MPKKSLQSNSQTAKLLLELDEALDFWFTMATNQTAVLKYGMDGVRRMRDAKARQRRREALKELERQQVLKIEKTADQYIAKLTLHGTHQLFRLQVMRAAKLSSGIYCVVMFDIPEPILVVG